MTEPPEPLRGPVIVRATMGGAAVFLVAAALGAIWPDPLQVVTATVSLVLFALGILAFLAGFAVAVGRSRTEEISVAGLFWLAEVDAGPAKRLLLGSLAAEVVGAIAASAVRPFTAVAFSVLAPMHALGFTGLWAARHAAFSRRRDQ
jgi:hypothetical protein